ALIHGEACEVFQQLLFRNERMDRFTARFQQWSVFSEPFFRQQYRDDGELALDQAADDFLAFRHKNLLLPVFLLTPHSAVRREFGQVQCFNALDVQHDDFRDVRFSRWKRKRISDGSQESTLKNRCWLISETESLHGNAVSKNVNKSTIFVQPNFWLEVK